MSLVHQIQHKMMSESRNRTSRTTQSGWTTRSGWPTQSGWTTESAESRRRTYQMRQHNPEEEAVRQLWKIQARQMSQPSQLPTFVVTLWIDHIVKDDQSRKLIATSMAGDELCAWKLEENGSLPGLDALRRDLLKVVPEEVKLSFVSVTGRLIKHASDINIVFASAPQPWTTPANCEPPCNPLCGKSSGPCASADGTSTAKDLVKSRSAMLEIPSEVRASADGTSAAKDLVKSRSAMLEIPSEVPVPTAHSPAGWLFGKC